MKKNIPKLLPIILIVFAFSGCYNSIENALYNGNYEEVLVSSLQKMKNDRKKDEYIGLALKAYTKVMEADKYQIEKLKASGEAANWGKIYYIYQNMEFRQANIEPYLPLTYNSGEVVDIATFNYIPVIEEARKNAASYHYNKAKDFLAQPTKAAARDAFYELNQIDQYYKNYLDKENLRSLAKERGTNKVFIDFKQSYGINLPTDFLSTLGQYNYENALNDWSKLYRYRTDSSMFDLVIQVTIDGVEISPEYIKEIQHHEEKVVQDGLINLINSEGNVVKDSLGNIIQVPKYKTLYCDVTEWQQNKSARIISKFEIFDNRYQNQVVHQPIEDQVLFQNYYARATGQTDILGSSYQDILKGRPLPFPTNFEMLNQTAESLKRQIMSAIDNNREALASL